MGVRGLTAFINDNKRKFLKPYKLHDSYLIIDGNCLAAILYMNSVASTSYFGGDYDKYAVCVENFFRELAKCSVTPLVIFDGGYEMKKLNTVISRNKNRVISLETVSPSNYSSQCTPLMMRAVLREKLKELSIPFAQSDFEADGEIAALGRKLNCPVLSNDSDFFIFDVLYLPLNEFPLTSTESPDGSFSFMECRLYNVENFLSVLGGLSRQLLPILAVLLGNDYISRRVFSNFYSQMKFNTKRKAKNIIARVGCIIEWLKLETFDSALTKVLGHLKKYRKKAVAYKVAKIIEGYTKVSSPLDSYLLKDDFSHCDMEIISVEYIMDKYEKTSEYHGENELVSAEDDENQSSDDSDSSEDLEGVDNSNSNLMFPPWFLEFSRKGLLPSCLITLRSLKTYFAVPQLEDYAFINSSEIGLPIILKMSGLVLGKSQFYLYSRSKSNYTRRLMQTVVGSKSFKRFPDLADLNLMTLADRKLLFAEIFENDHQHIVELFPPHWQLVILSLLFWSKNLNEPKLQIYYLHAITFMLLCVQIVGSKIGFYRNKRPFMQRFASKLKEIKANSTGGKEFDHFQNFNFNDMFNAVPESECLLAFESVLPYFHFEESIRCKPKMFSKTPIHAYSQFQVVIDLANSINSLLLFPFESCKVHNFYNSTFLYNITINFKRRSNVSAYVETLFAKCPTLDYVYKQLINVFSGLSALDSLVVVRKKKKRKNKTTCKIVNVNETCDVSCHSTSEFSDEDNTFNLLSKMSI